MNVLDYIVNKYKPLAFGKWQEVYNIMSVHTQGYVPYKIFGERRPLESKNQDVLNFRAENHRAITKNEFDKAINDYISTANNIDIVVDYGSTSIKEYEDSLKIISGYRALNLKDYIINRVGWYKQTDPNAVIAILPKHISEEFITKNNNELPNFNNIINQKIDVDIKLVPYYDIVYIDYANLIFKGGDYEYNDKGEKEPFYWILNKDNTQIAIPKQIENKIVYEIQTYYSNQLSIVPFINIGSKLVIERNKDEYFEYFISDYHGAVAWGDLAIGQGSDLRVSEIRFVYPRHWKIKVNCDNTLDGCHYDNEYKRYVVDGNKTCTRCNGTGYLIDTTPNGTLLINRGGTFLDENGKFTMPEGFITPDTTILKHSADREQYYFDRMLNALNVSQQNLTNQSAESKSYDVAHKVDMVTNIVTDLFKVYEYVLNVIAQYRSEKDNIKISLPEDFDIKNSIDYIIELVEAKKNGSPYIVIVELTKRYLLKNFGNSKTNEFIINELSKIDKLFAYGTDDIAKAKAIFGSDITIKDVALHHQGYQILKTLIENDETIIEKTTSEIKKLLESEIDKALLTNNTPTLV